MKSIRFDYESFLSEGVELLKSSGPKILCIQNVKLMRSEKLMNPTPMDGFMMTRGNVYAFCTPESITLYERDIYQDILMVDIKLNVAFELLPQILTYIKPRAGFQKILGYSLGFSSMIGRVNSVVGGIFSFKKEKNLI